METIQHHRTIAHNKICIVDNMKNSEKLMKCVIKVDNIAKKNESIAAAFSISIATLLFGAFQYLGGLVLEFYKMPILYQNYMFTLGNLFMVIGIVALIASWLLYIFGGFD
jgi:hypothetical protein